MRQSGQNRRLLWAAVKMMESFCRDKNSKTFSNHLPGERWTRLLKLERQFCNAVRHGYAGARRVCFRNMSDQIRLLMADLSAFEEELTRLRSGAKTKTSIRLLYEELLSLNEEFAIVDVDQSLKEVFVHTEQIILEGVELGRFEIRLSFADLNESQPYRIVALNPNGPVSDDSVTHPHVQSQRLCAGDGSYAIISALAEGRLSDFFLTVRQILQTYNPSSAYVSLDDWNGTICHDCGDTVDSDDTSGCEQCDCRQCDRCTCCCQNCDISLCASCTENCADCEQSHCRNCLNCCQSCEDSFCRYCLDDELCQSCRDLTEESKNAESENPSTDTEKSSPDQKKANETTASPDSSLQPLCVGEVDLST